MISTYCANLLPVGGAYWRCSGVDSNSKMLIGHRCLLLPCRRETSDCLTILNNVPCCSGNSALEDVSCAVSLHSIFKESLLYLSKE